MGAKRLSSMLRDSLYSGALWDRFYCKHNVETTLIQHNMNQFNVDSTLVFAGIFNCYFSNWEIKEYKFLFMIILFNQYCKARHFR